MSSESDFDDSESDFDSETDLSHGELVQQDPPPVQTVMLQHLPPPVRDVQQTSGQKSGQFLNSDPRYSAIRADSAEQQVKVLVAEMNSLYRRFYELQDMCKKLEEENKSLQAQLATQKQDTQEKLRW